jgi:uncharacterized protein HemX
MSNTALLIFVAVGIAIIPGIALYSHWKIARDHRNKKRKIADFLEKAAESQLNAKDPRNDSGINHAESQ